MRRLTALLALAYCLALPGALAGEDDALAAERKAVEQAARDYIDGWYEGSVERMERALHPDLGKRSVREVPGGGAILNSLTRDTMVAYTRAGFGKKSRKEGQVNEVIILDLSPRMASVKTLSHEFVDYLHLAKVDGRWRIVNVLWEPAAP
jgi:hypothetical protein